MATDNTKLNYLSSWDIDQLFVEAEETLVGSGTTALYTIPATLPAIPEFEVQFSPISSGYWCQAGTYGSGATDYFYSYVESGVISIVTNASGTARLYVWVDKVNY